MADRRPGQLDELRPIGRVADALGVALDPDPLLAL